jgi:hypothetical protein
MNSPPSDPSVNSDDALTLRTTFGSQKRKGPWVVPSRIVVHQRFGSTSLDFREATFASPVVTLELDVIAGAVLVRVPEQVTVNASAVSVLIGSVNKHDNAPPPPPGGPVLNIVGRMIYGSLNIRRPR